MELGNMVFTEPTQLDIDFTSGLDYAGRPGNQFIRISGNFNGSINFVDKDSYNSLIFTVRNSAIFNAPVFLPNNVGAAAFMFSNCANFNQPVTINPPNILQNRYVLSAVEMFSNDYAFDCPVSIPSTVFDYSSMFRNCNHFNHPMIISCPNHSDLPGLSLTKKINFSTSAMFANCYNFDSAVTFANFHPDNAVSFASMFSNCHNFDKEINIASDGGYLTLNNVYSNNSFSAFNMARMFFSCYKMNSPVIIPDIELVNLGINTYESAYPFEFISMFSNAHSFNQPVSINATVVNGYMGVRFTQMFDNAYNMNSPISINLKKYGGDTVTRAEEYIFYRMFNGLSYGYESDINISINHQSTHNAVISFFSFAARLFNFNGNVYLDLNINSANTEVNMRQMFGSTNYNKPFNFDCLSHVTNLKFNAFEMFSNSNYNCPIYIHDIDTKGLLDFTEFVEKCNNFNQPITFENITTLNNIYLSRAFMIGNNFNQEVIFSNITANEILLGSLFTGDNNFNSLVTFSSIIANRVSCYEMFRNCKKFNQPISFPQNTSDCSEAFNGCSSFNQDLYIPDKVGTYYSSILSGCWNYKKTISLPRMINPSNNALGIGLEASSGTLGARAVYRSEGRSFIVTVNTSYSHPYYYWQEE